MGVTMSRNSHPQSQSEVATNATSGSKASTASLMGLFALPVVKKPVIAMDNKSSALENPSVRRFSRSHEDLELLRAKIHEASNSSLHKRTSTRLDATNLPKSRPLTRSNSANSVSSCSSTPRLRIDDDSDGSDTEWDATEDHDYHSAPRAIRRNSNAQGSFKLHKIQTPRQAFQHLTIETENEKSRAKSGSPVLVNLPWFRNANDNPRRSSSPADRLSPFPGPFPWARSPTNAKTPAKQPFQERQISSSGADEDEGSEEYHDEYDIAALPTKEKFKHSHKLTKGVDQEGRKTLNQYAILQFLGKGQYGKVKLCTDTVTGELVAIKIVPKTFMKDDKNSLSCKVEFNIKQEIGILKVLDHPNIVSLFEVIDDPNEDKVYMVFEYVDGGELIEVKIDGTVEAEPMPEAKARKYFVQLLNGVEYLHNNQIVHRDIKPSNLLVTKDGDLKISDFGVSRLYDGEDDTFIESMGTPAFLPPEACGSGQMKGRSADIWACGVTLYTMIFGLVPFTGQGTGPGRLFSLFLAIQHDPIEMPFDVSVELKDLFRLIFAKDVEQRINLQELKVHPWVLDKTIVER